MARRVLEFSHTLWRLFFGRFIAVRVARNAKKQKTQHQKAMTSIFTKRCRANKKAPMEVKANTYGVR
jgi:hypothetical protein